MTGLLGLYERKKNVVWSIVLESEKWNDDGNFGDPQCIQNVFLECP